jgi:hypothetical protein
MNKDMNVQVENKTLDREIAIYFYKKMPNGNVLLLSNVEFVEVDPSIAIVEGSQTLSLSYQTAQKLMNNLWNCGLRPSENYFEDCILMG